MRDRRDSDRIDRATARPPGAAAGEGERRGRREIRDYSTYFKGEITVLLYGPWAHATATETRRATTHERSRRDSEDTTHARGADYTHKTQQSTQIHNRSDCERARVQPLLFHLHDRTAALFRLVGATYSLAQRERRGAARASSLTCLSVGTVSVRVSTQVG
jgi:hypothetical protein